ncbi:ATP-binding protein [Hyphomicrobium sp. NDB2Meth4]|uniref:ATP-binding protein n=1 Tax=Hyphomicrobium sp. NDB2Meth4 TaxID=1892846 RepID=UPI00093010EE|nr:ATP-binding protein [Hyphomicrobium sp. NDB2Meth4]
MNSLRVKLAMLLVVVIVAVVGLLTAVMVYFLGPPPGRRHSIQPVVEVIEMLARAAEAPGVLPLKHTLPGGMLDPFITDNLQEELRQRGSSLDVRAYRGGPEQPSFIAARIEGKGWLTMPLPDLPPPGAGWGVMGKWLLLLTFGAVTIAVFVANRMVRPLVLLENAVEAVGPDAILPELPEQGPAEVRATARALNLLSARLRSAMESRMRLVAAAGHDLRTPITRLRLRAEFVVNAEEKEAWLRDLDELERIADSAIELVRDESDKAPPQDIDLAAFVRETALELRNQDLDVEVGETEPVEVRTRRLALSRALRNLMINAATHGVRAHVVVTEADGKALVRITDEGPGIPEGVIGRVFEPFFRVDPARRQSIPGAGLGLSIAREIIQRAGGAVRIYNGPHVGLVQEIELPIAQRAS